MRFFKTGYLFVVLAAALLTACAPAITPEQAIAQAESEWLDGDYRAAVIRLKNVLRDDASNVRARWILGQIYLDQEDGPSAEKELVWVGRNGVEEDAVLPSLARALLMQGRYDEVLALAPEAPLSASSAADLAANRVLALIGEDALDQARSELNTALEGVATTPWTLYANASLRFAEQNLAGAKENIEQILEIDPEYGLAWSLLGDIAREEKDYKAAEDAYSKAIRYRIANYTDVFQRGVLRLGSKDLDGALSDSEILLIANRDDFAGYFLRGAVLVERGEFSQADEALDRSRTLNPRHFPTLLYLAAVKDQLGQTNAALSIAETAASMEPDSVVARKMLSKLYIQNGMLEEAEERLRPVVAADDSDIEAKDMLALVLVQQLKLKEAVRLYEELLVERGSLEDRLRAGSAMVALGRVEDGKQVFRTAGELSPGEIQVSSAAVASLIGANRSDAALESAERFVEANPDSGLGWVLVGLSSLAVGDRDGAERAFQQAIEVEPGLVDASLRLSRMKRQRGDLEGARSLLAQAQTNTPKSPEVLFELAELETAAGNTQRAQSLLRETIELAPMQLQPRLALAQSLNREGDYDGALTVLNGFEFQNAPGARHARAYSLIQTGRLNEARDELEQLNAEIPNSAPLLIELAKVYGQLGEREKIRVTLSKVLDLEPNNAAITMVAINNLLAMNRNDEAAVLLNRISWPADHPDVMAANYLLAKQLGRTDEARVLALKMHAREGSTGTLLALVATLIEAGDVAEAESYLNAWMGAHPDDVAVARVRSQLLLRLERTEDAVAALTELDRLQPNDPNTLNNLAWLLRDDDPKRALDYAEHAVSLDGESVAVLDTYAEVLAITGDKDLALRTMDLAVRNSSNSPQFLLRRAQLLNRLGETETAKLELQRILESKGPVPAHIQQKAGELLSAW